MSAPMLVPPLKCQGIKTKLVPEISKVSVVAEFDRWVEPFCGSCVVAMNLQPKKALLTDSNKHLIRLYQEIQTGTLNSGDVKSYLTEEGEKLRQTGESFYYAVRERFNDKPTSLDFLFLNRSCFNGMMRFNRKGNFNVPYCHKSNRFAQSYVTKITNQIRRIAQVITANDWTFSVSDFRATLGQAKPGDLVYADPPYAGRHVDYYNSWSESDERELSEILKGLPCNFILSTWHSNEFRANSMISSWDGPPYFVRTHEHFYHVGPTEDLRHPMVEALVTNFPVPIAPPEIAMRHQLAFPA
jgi:DNA adenine methylase